MAGFGAKVPAVPVVPGPGEMRGLGSSIAKVSTAALVGLPKDSDIRPVKNDLKWQPFRTKMRRQGNPFYTMGYPQEGK